MVAPGVFQAQLAVEKHSVESKPLTRKVPASEQQYADNDVAVSCDVIRD